MARTAGRLERQARTETNARNARLAIYRANRLGIDDESSSSSEEEEYDDDFVQAPRGFRLEMRFVQARYNGLITVPVCDAAFRICTPWHRILGRAGRENLNAIMGRVFAVGMISAARIHGTVRWTVNRYRSSEWCHLIADSLGGPSSANNLVAAGFHANTYMACIEALLLGRTDLEVQVEVLCSSAHCAEVIIYRIRHGRLQHILFQVRINARALGFSSLDRDMVQALVNTFLRRCPPWRRL